MLSCSCGDKKEESEIDIKTLIAQKCSICHFSDRVFQEPRGQKEWEVLVERMRLLNPQILSQEEALLMTEYFQENLSK
jgi:hypothetical protein